MLFLDAATVQVWREELPDGYLSFSTSWALWILVREAEVPTVKPDVEGRLLYDISVDQVHARWRF